MSAVASTSPKTVTTKPDRTAATFARCRAEGRKALVLYLTVGDPDAETSRRLLVAAARAGADIIEVGVPWSDPSADGPAIQAAMLRALKQGGGLTQTLGICRAVRAEAPDVPLVLFGYANPVFQRGPKAFAAAAADAGIDAVLCVDWPPDEAGELTSHLRSHSIDFVPLLAPTSTLERMKRVVPAASGFVYYASLTGITGVKLADMEGPRRKVAEIRSVAGNLPIAVGFGIKTPDDARQVAAFADGVVVGTAAVKVIEDAVKEGRDPVPALEAFVKALRAAL
jgi:tryptophan synthase alpha chain